VQALENDIKAWIATWNDNPRPFTWTKTADEILSSLADYLAKVGPAHRIDRQDQTAEFPARDTRMTGHQCGRALCSHQAAHTMPTVTPRGASSEAGQIPLVLTSGSVTWRDY